MHTKVKHAPVPAAGQGIRLSLSDPAISAVGQSSKLRLDDPKLRAPSVLEALNDTERGIERFGHVIALGLILVFGVWAWFASRELRLWFDELLGIAVAKAPTSRQIFSFLKAGVDSNPPLSHFLTRGSMSLLGDSDFAARAPAFVGFVTMLVCLYLYTSRWLTRSYGILALLAVMCSPVRDYAWNARPYGLVLGFCGLALLFHRQAAKAQGRILALAGFSLCTAGLVASHYYAILAVGPFLLAEAARAWESKKPDWALLAASVGPPVIVLAALRPLWGSQRLALAHYWGRGNLLSFNAGYVFLAMDPLIYVMALLLITVVLGLSYWNGRLAGEIAVPPHITTPEVYLGAGFLSLPIVGAFLTQFVTHAYSARYFLPAVLGFALCLCYAARMFSSIVPGLTVLLTLAMGLGFGRELMRVVSHPAEQLSEGAALGAENLPIVFDNAGDYMQVQHYFPGLRERLWVIADPAASLKYRNYDTDDKEMLALASQGGAQTITLGAAAERWGQFSLIPRTRDDVWALQCALESGARVQVQHAFRSSWPNPGESNFVFDVTVNPESLVRILACSPATSGSLGDRAVK